MPGSLAVHPGAGKRTPAQADVLRGRRRCAQVRHGLADLEGALHARAGVGIALEGVGALLEGHGHGLAARERHRRDLLAEPAGTQQMWKLWMLDLSATLIVYWPGLSVLTGLPALVSVIVKPGPTVPASCVAAEPAKAGAASARPAAMAAVVSRGVRSHDFSNIGRRGSPQGARGGWSSVYGRVARVVLRGSTRDRRWPR